MESLLKQLAEKIDQINNRESSLVERIDRLSERVDKLHKEESRDQRDEKRSKTQEYTLFFDGASKGNPGKSAGGWILISNNKVEAF